MNRSGSPCSPLHNHGLEEFLPGVFESVDGDGIQSSAFKIPLPPVTEVAFFYLALRLFGCDGQQISIDDRLKQFIPAILIPLRKEAAFLLFQLGLFVKFPCLRLVGKLPNRRSRPSDTAGQTIRACRWRPAYSASLDLFFLLSPCVTVF